MNFEYVFLDVDVDTTCFQSPSRTVKITFEPGGKGIHAMMVFSSGCVTGSSFLPEISLIKNVLFSVEMGKEMENSLSLG